MDGGADRLISVKADVKEVTRWLTDIEKRQIPFATRLALMDTAKHLASDVLPKDMQQIFDRPTQWTLRGSMRTSRAGKKT